MFIKNEQLLILRIDVLPRMSEVLNTGISDVPASRLKKKTEAPFMRYKIFDDSTFIHDENSSN